MIAQLTRRKSLKIVVIQMSRVQAPLMISQPLQRFKKKRIMFFKEDVFKAC